MCGRYFLEPEDGDEALRQIIEILNRRGEEAKFEGEVFPTDVVPALAGGKIVRMQWGFSKPIGKGQIINARSETAGEKPMFRRAFESARCLIPASGYYEWGRVDRKKYAMACADPVIYMAGLYRKEAPDAPARFVILTRDASPSVSGIHERMPVILAGDARRAWLNVANSATSVLQYAKDDVVAACV